jgi:hypothetical protein
LDGQEFEESGDPEGHFQALLALAKEGLDKGKVVYDYFVSKQAKNVVTIIFFW